MQHGLFTCFIDPCSIDDPKTLYLYLEVIHVVRNGGSRLDSVYSSLLPLTNQ